METEQQLLSAIRNGEREAAKRLYERYAGYAQATGLRYIADADAVRDVLQDSFVKILTSLDRFHYRGEGSLKAWVLRIVANRAIDYLHEHERLVFTDHIPDTPDEEPDIGDLPPDVLTALIAQLPTGYRMVLNLYVFEGYSHRQIAQQLGIKEMTSASQYLRAKKLLGKKISQYLKQGKL